MGRKHNHHIGGFSRILFRLSKNDCKNRTHWKTCRTHLVRILMSIQAWLYVSELCLMEVRNEGFILPTSQSNYCYYLALINCSSSPLRPLHTVLKKSLYFEFACALTFGVKELYYEPLKNNPCVSGHESTHAGDMNQPTVGCFLDLSPPS